MTRRHAAGSAPVHGGRGAGVPGRRGRRMAAESLQQAWAMALGRDPALAAVAAEADAAAKRGRGRPAPRACRRWRRAPPTPATMRRRRST